MWAILFPLAVLKRADYHRCRAPERSIFSPAILFITHASILRIALRSSNPWQKNNASSIADGRIVPGKSGKY